MILTDLEENLLELTVLRPLNGCLRDLAVAIKPYITTGVPELDIPAADPLILDEIAFDLKNPIIDVHVEFTDNEVTGRINNLIFLDDLIGVIQVSPNTNCWTLMPTKKQELSRCPCSFRIPSQLENMSLRAKSLFLNWRLMIHLHM